MSSRAGNVFGRRAAWAVAVLAVAAVFGCGRPDGQGGGGEGPGGRRQPLALSPKQEWQVGQRAYREILGEYQRKILPDTSPEAVRVRRIMGRLARAAEIEPLQREINLRTHGYRFEWQTHVVRDRQVNAFCLPAGYIFVHTGILEVAGDSDDQLATVLSHEAAHALAHHASERVAREQTSGGILGSLSYNRMQESEADHIGVFLMAFAGYDPNQAPVFWQRMGRISGARGGMPEFLSSHPSDERRMRDLREWAPDARAAKRAYDEGRVAPARRRAA
jgi:predicted Zn-dependent protease